MFFASWCVFYDCYIINRPISIVITFKLIYSCWPIPINDKATYCSILRLPHDKKMSYVFYLEHGSPVKTLWISRTSTAVIISISMVTNLHLHLLIDCTFDINSKSLNKTKQIFQQKTVPTKNDKTLNNKTVSNKYEGKMTKLSTKTDKALNKTDKSLNN